MCILLKLDYAKFGVFNLFFQKLSKKTFRKGRVNTADQYFISSNHTRYWLKMVDLHRITIE